jgi:2-desacetyl-2-hydroxyethyl bacteriochlorophyllide A dehydrogenase
MGETLAMKENRRLVLVFASPGSVRIEEEPIPEPQPGQVLVRARLSAISAGTEMLVYRGEFPTSMAVDTTISSLDRSFAYPLRYGYTVVGEVAASESVADEEWIGRRVFAFHPHESHFWASPEELIPIPDEIENDRAVFYPNMETAVTLVMDGRPTIGEKVVVYGQGVVGLLTAVLLSRYPLGSLVTLDRYPLRRSISAGLGIQTSLDPLDPQIQQLLWDELAVDSEYAGADLVYELTGSPRALDQAIRTAGFHGRVVVGSWYGTKAATLALGEHFHRSRIQILSSQVSSLNPEMRGRWNTARRTRAAWRMLHQIPAQSWITHCLPIQQASEAYVLLDKKPEEAVQVVLTY